MSDAKAKKAEIRSEIQSRLALLTDRERGLLDAGIFHQILHMPEFQTARNLFLYHSSGDEPDTRAIIDAALSAGKRVGLPRVIRRTHGMQVTRIENRAHDLESGYAGLMEPREGLAELDVQTLDLILMPGRAFDVSGNRLGRGAGHYDRWLEKAALNPKIVLMAIAYEVQLLSHIPTEPHDRKVNWIVTEKRVIKT